MRADEVKAILESIGKRPTKRLGQHFMLDDSVLKRMVAAADLGSKDTVLEIGPGLGNLTEELLLTGAKVVAVEQDPAFVQFLRRRFGERVELIQADAVKAFLPQFNRVVSNLPYQISSPIIFRLLDIGFESAVLMLQKEFAGRMVAKPRTEAYGRLSVGVYYRADCRIAFHVPRTAFWPQPRVDSCVVELTPKDPPFKVASERAFFEITKSIFSHRRKKIMNALNLPDYPQEPVAIDLRTLPYASKRAEELTPEMIGELTNAILKSGHFPSWEEAL
jgi:16S rRNA (adenine1518-N6/adenine1519-N6)-dimethyltransferase